MCKNYSFKVNVQVKKSSFSFPSPCIASTVVKASLPPPSITSTSLPGVSSISWRAISFNAKDLQKEDKNTA